MVRTNSTKDDKDIDVERDTELENIVGNLLIADYQVEKLKARLVERVAAYGMSVATTKQSTFTFRHGKKLYRIKLGIDEMSIE